MNNFIGELENMQNNQMELAELKNTISPIKNLMNLISRLSTRRQDWWTKRQIMTKDLNWNTEEKQRENKTDVKYLWGTVQSPIYI